MDEDFLKDNWHPPPNPQTDHPCSEASEGFHFFEKGGAEVLPASYAALRFMVSLNLTKRAVVLRLLDALGKTPSVSRSGRRGETMTSSVCDELFAASVEWNTPRGSSGMLTPQAKRNFTAQKCL